MPAKPPASLRDRHSVRIAIECIFQTVARNILHHHPSLPFVVVLDVKQRHQIRMLEVDALRDAADFDVHVPLDAFDGQFLAGVAEREIDFAESAHADSSLDGVSIKRPGSGRVGELHTSAFRLDELLRHGGVPLFELLAAFF